MTEHAKGTALPVGLQGILAGRRGRRRARIKMKGDPGPPQLLGCMGVGDPHHC